MSQVAKLFKNGRSQAVRLPVSYRFEGEEVYIRRDPVTGDVILSAKPRSFVRFFAALAKAEAPDDFLSPRERDQEARQRDPFESWEQERRPNGHSERLWLAAEAQYEAALAKKRNEAEPAKNRAEPSAKEPAPPEKPKSTELAAHQQARHSRKKGAGPE
jgi:antitoxin VapB